MGLIFVDFDGVVIDSIHECYDVALRAYSAHKDIELKHTQIQKELFYQNRGLVGPVYQYLVLLEAIHLHSKGTDGSRNIEVLFGSIKSQIYNDEKERFESVFFSERNKLLANISDWISLNPLTEYGKFLQSSTDRLVVVTTKNREAVDILLQYYDIRVEEVFSNLDVKNFSGSKGKLISDYMDRRRENKAIFIDDLVDHLDTVDDHRIACFFADWGYGKNSKYPVLKFGG